MIPKRRFFLWSRGCLVVFSCQINVAKGIEEDNVTRSVPRIWPAAQRRIAANFWHIPAFLRLLFWDQMSIDVINFWGSCSRLNPIKGSAMTLQSGSKIFFVAFVEDTSYKLKLQSQIWRLLCGAWHGKGHGIYREILGRFHLLASRFY